ANALTLYNEGDYAYWLAAGILTDRDEQMEINVINLFTFENMDYSAHMDEALTQLEELGFMGTWVCDAEALAAAYGKEYAGIDLEFTIDENGHGVTTMNGLVTADFEAYAVDTGEKGDGEGLYVAHSNLDSETNSATYTMLPSEAGNMVLTLYSDEGVISYIKNAA
ncbi:MAG: hypothetical protein IKE43_06155, partial [Coriobacteriales bacterium]|nr:hypothetical protein [Coriobacteriales bacterium]